MQNTSANLALALRLLSDELADQPQNPAGDLDQAVGRIVRELIRLCSANEPSGTEETLLDALVQIAVCATRAAADIGVAGCKEEGEEEDSL